MDERPPGSVRPDAAAVPPSTPGPQVPHARRSIPDGRVREILDLATRRDARADARDAAADRRDAEASLHSFLHDDAYAATLQSRRAGAHDRLEARADRLAAADDRALLAEDEAPVE